jgi:hypothetical protein
LVGFGGGVAPRYRVGEILLASGGRLLRPPSRLHCFDRTHSIPGPSPGLKLFGAPSRAGLGF